MGPPLGGLEGQTLGGNQFVFTKPTVIDKCLCGDVFKSRKTDHLTDTGRKAFDDYRQAMQQKLDNLPEVE